MTTEPNSLSLADGTDLLITLLYAPGKDGNINEPIEGITRLQKLMFLLQQGLGPIELVDVAKAYGYKPYKMGPYSEKLNEEIQELISVGIVKTEELKYWVKDDSDDFYDVDFDVVTRNKEVTSYKYSLTPKFGIDVGSTLWNGLPKDEKAAFIKFKSFFNSLSLRQLLIFAYEKFPHYTTKSTIKNKLNLY